VNEPFERKTTGPLKLKQTGSLKRKYPDLLETLEREPLEKQEQPIWREIRLMLAAKLYGAEKLSSERAAKLAGLPHVEFLLNLGFYKVFPLQAELNELEREMEREESEREVEQPESEPEHE
jgi:hypothetical protein